MSAASNTSLNQSAQNQSDSPSGLAARIDHAHPRMGADRSATAPKAASRVAAGGIVPLAGQDQMHSETNPEPVAKQAAELAERLQQRQEEIDRRTAMLSAHEAEIENKIRSARLWFDERQQELDAREKSLVAAGQAPTTPAEESPATSASEGSANQGSDAEALESRQRELDARQAELYQQIEGLTRQQAEIEEQTTDLSTREQALRDLEQSMESRRTGLADDRSELVAESSELSQRRIELHRQAEEQAEEREGREVEFQTREDQLAYRQQEIDTAIIRFEKLGVTQQRMQELDEQASQFATRSRYLDHAEALLGEETEKLAARQKEIEERSRTTNEQVLVDRRAVASEREAVYLEATQREKQVDQREAEIDTREESLQNLRLELENNQREVLEMRLATEETWAQLTGALTPASLTRSIAQTRSRLADLYEHQLSQLALRQGELEQFRLELENEHTDIDHRRTQFQDWIRRREQEIEQQAARLIAREQELDRQQMHYEAQESRWRLERDDYRTEIRKLLAQLRTDMLEAAA